MFSIYLLIVGKESSGRESGKESSSLTRKLSISRKREDKESPKESPKEARTNEGSNVSFPFPSISFIWFHITIISMYFSLILTQGAFQSEAHWVCWTFRTLTWWCIAFVVIFRLWFLQYADPRTCTHGSGYVESFRWIFSRQEKTCFRPSAVFSCSVETFWRFPVLDLGERRDTAEPLYPWSLSKCWSGECSGFCRLIWRHLGKINDVTQFFFNPLENLSTYIESRGYG